MRAAHLILAPLLLVLTQSGCSVPAKPAPAQPVTLPERFSASGEAAVKAQWWESYGDLRLNALVDAALRSNLSLQSTWERLAQARATAVKSAAGLYPDLSLDAGASAAHSFGDAEATSRSFSAGLAASYEIDLWGRVNASADAARFDLEASKENLRTAALSLSAEVATAWFNLVEQRHQALLLENQVALNDKYVTLIRRKFLSGQARASDLLQQRQSLEAVHSERTMAEHRIRLYEHQLALLLGKNPGTVHYETDAPLPDAPALPSAALPSELLMQRPDVKSAFYALQAADRRLAAAVAEQYPKLSLAASLNSSSVTASDLFRNWLATLAANLTAPLFDGGSRKAEAQRSEALRNEALYAYGQSLLGALKEVEDALSGVAHRRAYLEGIDAQLKLSEEAIAQLREQYLRGDGEFSAFLSAKLSHESLQRSRITAARELLDETVNLYRALATGWEPVRTMPTPSGEPHANQ